jgi:hypothetical protein
VVTIPPTAEATEVPGSPSLAEGTQALTTLAPIIPGRRQRLQQILAGVGERIAAGGPTPLDDIGTVHFARWVILPDEADGGTLLFTSNYDGTWETYIEDFAETAAQSFDAIYSNCEGWPTGGATDIDAFKAYIRKHQVASDVYYRAYPTATVREVRSALRFKEGWRVLMDELNE